MSLINLTKKEPVVTAIDAVMFEQPLNEQMRLCLRLEHLFQQIEYHLDKDSLWDTRIVVNVLFDLLNVLDRPDLKNKLGQTINQYIASFLQLEQNPQVNKQTLHKMVDQLNRAMDALHAIQGKIGQMLRENEFLISIQQRLSVPAGTCCFSTPAYHLWLHLPPKVRFKNLVYWCEPFEPLQKIINLLLKLTRDSTELKPKIAKAGFFQANLDPDITYQMMRIQMPTKYEMYPEISVGRHRLTIHFFEINPKGKANQTKKDVEFSLACCKLYTREEQQTVVMPNVSES
jgi:cell division protein ZapD